jgi:hypothetical protein
MAKAWYFMMGENPMDPKSYYKVSTHNCLCGDRICSIYLKDNGTQPLAPFSSNMQKYITDAMATQQLQPMVPYNAKKYVYLRDS